VDFETMKQRQAHVWGLGEYRELSRVLEPAARVLADACAVSAGQEALDVAAGDGNFALACASEGAGVVATDISPGQVERGRARSEEEGYDIEWQVADAEDLPFDDERFDCAGSVFGMMIAPRPEVAAREIFRVVRPGNTVGITAWTPGSFCVEMFQIGRSYLPLPAGVPTSDEWGREDTVRERFDGLAGTLEMERHTLDWKAPSPDEFVSALEGAAPPQVAAREALSPEQLESMHADYLALVGRWAGGDGPVSIGAEYLVAVARKRG
jgi:SAM-dependent methyltransferase